MIIMARFITWALVSLIVIATVASLLDKPLMSVVAPVYAEDHHGSAASFGVMLAAFGAGDPVATLAFSVVEHQLPRRLTFLACMLVAPVVMFGALSATPPLAMLLVALAVFGVIFGPMNSLSATAIQETTPRGLLGHVIGTVSALSMVGNPLGPRWSGLWSRRLIGLRERGRGRAEAKTHDLFYAYEVNRRLR
jgi:MFS family permease